MDRENRLDQETIDAFVNRAHGDLDGVKEMLARQPALLHARSNAGETALGAAAHVGNRSIAEYLLQQGAEPEM